MRAIELFHLRRVRDKPRALALIAARGGLAPDAAQAVLHAAIGGARPQLCLPDDTAARACIVALAGCGFVARFAAQADDGAAARAQQALHVVLPGCPRGVADAVAAALLQGDWAEALALALQHLQMHRPPQDADRLLLQQAAIDCGLVCGVPGRV